MIVLSGALVLVALVLLVVGAMGRDLPYVYGSIGVSVTALLLLFLSILQRRGQSAEGEPAGEVQVAAADEPEREPVLVGAAEQGPQEQVTGDPARPTAVSRLSRRPRPSEQDAPVPGAPADRDGGGAEVDDAPLGHHAAYDEHARRSEHAAYEDETDEAVDGADHDGEAYDDGAEAAYEDEDDEAYDDEVEAAYEDEDEDGEAYDDGAEAAYEDQDEDDEAYDDGAEAAYEDEDGAARHDDGRSPDALDEEGVRLVPSPRTGQPTSSAQVLVVAGRPRYHLSACRYLAGKSPEPVALDDARSRGFSPCGVCKPDAVLAERSQAAEPEEERHGWQRAEDEQRQVGWAQDEQHEDEQPEDREPEDTEPEAERAEHERLTAVPATTAPPDDDVLTLEHVLFGERVFGGPPAQADEPASSTADASARSASPEPESVRSAPGSAEPGETQQAELGARPVAAADQPAVATDAPHGDDAAEEPGQAQEHTAAAQAGTTSADEAATATGVAPTTRARTRAPRSRSKSSATAAGATEALAGTTAARTTPGTKTPGTKTRTKAAATQAPTTDAPATKAPRTRAPARTTQAKTPARTTQAKTTQAKTTPAKTPAKTTPATARAAATGSAARASGSGSRTAVPEAPPVRTTSVRAVRADALRLTTPTGATTTRRVAVRAAAPGARAAAPAAAQPAPPAGSSAPAARTGTGGRGAGRVVVIPDRGRFHRADCRYVRGVEGATTLTKAAAAEQGYVACGVCQP